MPLVIFAVVAIVMFGLFLALVYGSDARLRSDGYVRSQVPPSRDVAHVFDRSRSVTLRGGSRVAGRNATVPLATLTFDRSWVRLKTFGQRRSVWIARDEINAVFEVKGLTGAGVGFRAGDGRFDGVVFWTLSLGDAMRALVAYGWPVKGKEDA